MDLFKLDIGEIVNLPTDIGINGAFTGAMAYSDQLFEYIVGIAVLIYEMYP